MTAPAPTSRATPAEAVLSNPDGLGDTLRQLREQRGALAELAFVVGVLNAVAGAAGEDAMRLAAVEEVLRLHREVAQKDRHGPFSTCPDGCPLCVEACIVSEVQWRAGMQARGVDLVDVSTLPPEEQAAYARDAALEEMAAEHAAAADPDRDYGRDLDGDD